MSGMRFRGARHEDEEDDGKDQMKRIARHLKMLDVYPKTEEEFTIKTNTGATISLISFAIIGLLLLSNLWTYVFPPESHSISVDTRTSSFIPVNFAMTFHNLRCSETAIDVMDVSGEQSLDYQTDIKRQRLTKAEQRNNWRQYPIGPEFGEDEEENEEHRDHPGEGCYMHGSLVINKVAGNLHIALGGHHQHHAHPPKKGPTGAPGHPHMPHQPVSHVNNKEPQQPSHSHQFMLHEMLFFNASHTIHYLQFGDAIPGVINPLDGVSQSVTSPFPNYPISAHFQYFLKIVPTIYEDSVGNALYEGNQYSVTNQTSTIEQSDLFHPDGRKIPGVFFIYDLSPFMVHIRVKRMAFSTFITQCCAVVGGVLTVAGIIDSLIFHSAKYTGNKPL